MKVATRERVLQFAEDHPEHREAILELAGKWRHGYIPLDAVAWAIKMKHQRGDGKRRKGISRGSQGHLEPYRAGGGTRRPGGKARTDVAEQLRNVETATGSRGKSRARRPVGASSAPRDPFTGKTRMEELKGTAASLKARREGGFPDASRRAARRRREIRAEDRTRAGGTPFTTSDQAKLNDKLAAEPAAPAKAKRAPSPLFEEYRRLRDEQMTRFENSRNGGVAGRTSKRGGKTEEEKAYFGEGENMGRGGTEERLTYRKFLEGRRKSPEERDHQAAYDAGAKLGAKHGRRGTTGPAADSEYSTAEGEHHADYHDSFGGGYSDGLLLGANQAEKRQARKAELDALKPAPSVESAKVRDLKPRAAAGDKAAQAELDRRAQARAKGSPRRGLNDYGTRHDQPTSVAGSTPAGDRIRQQAADGSTANALKESRAARQTDTRGGHAVAAVAHAHAAQAHLTAGNNRQAAQHARIARMHQSRAEKPQETPTDVNARLRAERAADPSKPSTEEQRVQQVRDMNLAGKLSRGYSNAPATAGELKQLRDSPYLSSEQRAEAGRRLEEANYQTAKSRLGGLSDEKLAEVAPRLRQLPVEHRRAAARVIRERIAERKAAAPKARDLKETHPVGMQVDAKQPGIDRVTPGIITSHEPNGMVKVGYRDRHGKAVQGTFNPAHVTPSHRAELVTNVGEPGAPVRDTNRAAAADEATRRAVAASRAADSANKDNAAADVHRSAMLAQARAGNDKKAAQHRRLAAAHERRASSRRNASDQAALDEAARRNHVNMGAPAHGFKPGDKVTVGRQPATYVGVTNAGKSRVHTAEGPKIVEHRQVSGPAGETPEQTAKRLGVEFTTPTVAKHGLVGDGAKVEAPSEARRFGQAANSGQAANVQEAQAAERAARQAKVKPVQGEMFGASGEHQADLFDSAGGGASKPSSGSSFRDFHRQNQANLESARARDNAEVMRKGRAAREQQAVTDRLDAGQARIQIEHSGDGTTVHGTTREDAPKLKEHGFRWSRNLGAWYLPRTQHESTRSVKANALAKDLGSEAHLNVGDRAKSGTGEEQAAARIARAREIADEQRARAGKLQAASEGADAASRQILDNIPMGQPILVGHHSEARHRRDLARAHSNMTKAAEAQREAEHAAGRAQSADARARLEEDPRFAARRLERNSAELRKVQRSLASTPADSPHHATLDAMRRDLEASTARDQAVIDAKGNGLGKHNVQAGDLVHHRGEWHIVQKPNAKTVAVPHWNDQYAARGGTDKIPYSQLNQRRDLSAASSDTLKKLADKPGLSSAVLARIRAILSERGD